jgi:hypothetical protein
VRFSQDEQKWEATLPPYIGSFPIGSTDSAATRTAASEEESVNGSISLKRGHHIGLYECEAEAARAVDLFVIERSLNLLRPFNFPKEARVMDYCETLTPLGPNPFARSAWGSTSRYLGVEWCEGAFFFMLLYD